MGKAYDVPGGNAPPEQPEQSVQPGQPTWAAQLNAGAQAVGVIGGDVPAPAPAAEPSKSVAAEQPVVLGGPSAVGPMPPISASDTDPIPSPVPETETQTAPLECMIDGCSRRRKLRGMCARCHTAAVKWVDNRERFPSKEAGWNWLVQKGHALPSTKASSDQFFLNSVNATLAKEDTK